jgi:SdrD B-like protein
MLRVPLVLVALVAAPLVTSVAQERAARPEQRRGEDQRCKDKNQQPAAIERAAAGSNAREALQRNADRKAAGCPVQQPPAPPPVVLPPPPVDTQPTPPPPPADTTPTPLPTNAEIHGMAFVDNNGNGMWDWDDYAAEGWGVELSGPVTATAATDVFGNYSFKGLPEGTYMVCGVRQPGWTQTIPFSGNSCPTDGILPDRLSYSRTATPGSQIRFIGIDFANQPPPQ